MSIYFSTNTFIACPGPLLYVTHRHNSEIYSIKNKTQTAVINKHNELVHFDYDLTFRNKSISEIYNVPVFRRKKQNVN